MDTLGINFGASGNLKTFKRMTVDTRVLTYGEVVVWRKILSQIEECPGLGDRAEDIAQRLVVDEQRDVR